MYRGTTPTVRWWIDNDDIDFSKITEVFMTFEDHTGFKITIKKPELTISNEERYIQYTLSQEQTLHFKSGTVRTQLRILIDNKVALASEIKEITLKGILKGGII